MGLLRIMSLFAKGIWKMTKLSFGAHPFLLGFEQLERLVERTAKASGEGYPPFNIEAAADNAYRITLAVASLTGSTQPRPPKMKRQRR